LYFANAVTADQLKRLGFQSLGSITSCYNLHACCPIMGERCGVI